MNVKLLTTLLMAFLFVPDITNAGKARVPERPSGQVIVVKPQVIQTLAHDSNSFTQGLLFRGKFLYESAGLYGQSTLRRIDPHSGAVLFSAPVPDVFAEGLACFDSMLIQLTWKENVAITYEYPSLRPKGTLRYEGEGWGLTAHDEQLMMSNGSDTLYFRDSHFAIIRALPVTLNGKPLARLNELEYIRGNIYSNVWYCDSIFVIAPSNGHVTGILNCTELVRLEKPSSEQNVLNGIAYDPVRHVLFITGKNWKHLFIVTIPGL